MMNQRQAGNILRRNAPKGEHPAFINQQEANWLKGMGGSGKKTKSGLRSYVPDDGLRGDGTGDAPDSQDQSGRVDSSATSQHNMRNDRREARYQAMSDAKYGPKGEGGTGPDGRIDYSGGGVPPAPTLPTPDGGGVNNPLAGGSGHETRTPTGPGSVTNPNDPYGVQEAVATGAKDLINKEYEAPTLSPEDRIAATSAETTQAREGVQAMQGTGQGAYGEAAAVGKKISGQTIDPISGQSFLTGQGVDEYMSPHTGNVIKGMQDNAMRTMQKQRNALQAQHQMAGAGVGSRGALENAAMSAEVQRGLGQQVAGALEGSYAQAAKMKQSDMEREQQRQRYNQMATGEEGRLNIAGAQEQRAGTAAGRDAAAADINMLSGVGADVEGRNQNVLDETMGDFYEKRDWGENKLASAANIASTNPTGSTTTTTGAPQHKKRDKWGRIISGAAGGFLASGGNPWGAVAGGVGGMFS